MAHTCTRVFFVSIGSHKTVKLHIYRLMEAYNFSYIVPSALISFFFSTCFDFVDLVILLLGL